MLFTILAAAITLTAPSSCFSPCDFKVVLRVTPAADNVMVVLEIGAPDSDYYRRSDIEYDAKSARTRELPYIGVPEGTYTVLATLWKRGLDGRFKIADSASKRLRILGDNVGIGN